LKKTTIHIIFLIAILTFSCKEGIKKEEKIIVQETEKVDTLKKAKKKIEPKKKLDKQFAIDTLIIQNDTLFIHGNNFLNKTETHAKCEGKLDEIHIYFIGKTDLNSDFSFCVGKDPNRNGLNESKPTILLLKSDRIIDKLELNNFFSPYTSMHINNPIGIRLKNIDEIIEFSFSQSFGGGYNGTLYFFRKENRLIKGFEIEQGGEPGTEYFYQNVKAPENNESNQIWVETKVGKDDIVYFTEIKKYELKDDSLIRLNPRKDNFYYVTSKEGLTQRAEPSINGESLGKLPYKTKVNVLNKTNFEITLDNRGEQINGHWVQIEYIGEQLYDNSFFVFDGYLSNIEPTE
jgi:hypothetical protein